MQLPSDDHQIALIGRIADGDADALGAFAEAVGPWVVAALERAVQDAELARDLTDRVFLEIWQTAPLWDRHVGRPLLWALAIGRAFAMEGLDERRRGRVEGPGSAPPDDPGRDEASLIGALLATIPPHRDVLEATWFGHPASADVVALPDAAALTEALESFAARLSGGHDGG